ncbi:MAG TPA: fibronectin type III domain-containing protein, partial [Nitrosopumilaceae archaeon]|nr:fibronectin type III domain-containing protein [Nitrosopumilaceae archaeon]
ATSYTLFRSISSSGPFTPIQAGLISTTFTDTTLSPSTTYFYQVTAVNAAGSSSPSNTVSLTTTEDEGTEPPAPTLSIASVTATSATLSWSSVFGATSYTLFRSISSSGPFTPIQAGLISTTFTDTTLSPSTTYFYQVTAVNAAGSSSPSNTVSVTREALTNMEAYNQFDPITKDVIVFGINGSGVSFGPITPTSVVKTLWEGDNSVDKNPNDINNGNAELVTFTTSDTFGNSIVLVEKGREDNKENKNTNDIKKEDAELRTFTINDTFGNSIVLVEKVKRDGNQIKVQVISVQHNGGEIITMPSNTKMFEWTVDENGNIEKLEQKMTVQKGEITEQVTAKFDGNKNQTVIHFDHLHIKLVKHGLVLLQMFTHNNDLIIKTS